MKEIIAILSEIKFWFLEKYQLRKYYGKGRPSNISDRKRNDIFYNKLEKELLPILESKKYFKKKKRIFIKNQDNKILYVNFALNKQLNGLVVEYGEIKNSNFDKNEDRISDIINNNSNFQRLKPDFWKFDYQYPVRRTDKFDEHIIIEIKNLLINKINDV